jgi:flagellar basal body-associated protein FliL
MSDNEAYPQGVLTPPPPVPPAPPATGDAPQPAPKKKRKGCLIAALIALVLLLLACGGGVALVAALVKPDEPAVTYSDADFDSAVTKLGVAWPQLPAGANPDDYERVYTGQRPMDVTLTEAELSALMSYRHGASYWPIKSMSVDVGSGNTAAVSATISYMGRDWPVEATGSGQISGSALSLDVASASVMGVDVPAEYLPYGASFLESVINPRLARAGISVDSLEVTEDGIHAVGLMWDTAEYVKK